MMHPRFVMVLPVCLVGACAGDDGRYSDTANITGQLTLLTTDMGDSATSEPTTGSGVGGSTSNGTTGATTDSPDTSGATAESATAATTTGASMPVTTIDTTP